MAKQQPHEQEQQLIAKMLTFVDNPETFVLFAFPWGKPNTPLENYAGPREWQRRALRKIAAQLAENRNLVAAGKPPKMIKLARASGRGIGKSAFLAWIALWLFSCLPTSTVIVSANTEQQLKSTTFPEIRKWATMAIHSRWFEHNAMSLRPAEWLVDTLKATTAYDDAYWYIQARLWSEESPDAYAGPHSQKGMAVLFDEASGIPSCIWPVANGYFTDKTVHRLWVVISNPRNPSGEFFRCFNENRVEWDNETIDARSVTENDPALYESIINQYGPDSDQARVEVYGQFPRQGDDNFISRGEVEDAIARELPDFNGAPLLMGVDPARMGQDKAVIRFRQGVDARSIPALKYPKCTTEQMAEHCATAIDKYRPDYVFVESDGIGGPVIELLEKAGYKIFSVFVGKNAQDVQSYFKHRTEIWARMRDWLSTACLPDDPDLVNDLCSARYLVNLKGQVQLWPKERMRKELGVASPDDADALGMTFSRTVSAKSSRTSRLRRRERVAKDVEYDMFV